MGIVHASCQFYGIFSVPRSNRLLQDSLTKSYDRQMAKLQKVRDALQNGIDRGEARSSFLWTHDQYYTKNVHLMPFIS